MTDSEAEILRQYSSDAGLGTIPTGVAGTLPAWSMFVGGEPSDPDNCITFYDTDGPDDGRSMVTGEVVGPGGVQVRIRATDYRTGWAKANAIRDRYMLVASGFPYRTAVTVSARNYVLECVVGIGNVIPLGKMLPQNRLSLFTLNVLVRAREAS